MKAASVFVSAMFLVPLRAWAVNDPVGDALTDSFGQIEDLVFASVEVDSELIHVDVDSTNSVREPSFSFSLDTDQDASTGFPGAYGGVGPDGGHVLDSSLGADYVVRWDSATGNLTVSQWDAGIGRPTGVYFDGTLLPGQRFSFPRDVIDDDGVMNYKVIATEPGGASSTGFIYDVLPDVGLAPATSVVVPEANGLILLGMAGAFGVVSMRWAARRKSPNRSSRVMEICAGVKRQSPETLRSRQPVLRGAS